MKEYWNMRYRESVFAYGEKPNLYFQEQLDQLSPGKILLPADGEGRNGVYAARQGWQTTSFDISIEGQKKAKALATKYAVSLEYQLGSCHELTFPKQHFDMVALVYAHLPGPERSPCFQKLGTYLKPGGRIILEAFSERHLEYRAKNPSVGGPQDLNMLLSLKKVMEDFPGFEILQLEEQEVELNEGKYHIGFGSVIRFVGIRK